MFKIFLHRKVEKNLYIIPKYILKKFYDLISDLEISPVPWRKWDVRKLKGLEDTYRIRLDKYRVVYWVNWKKEGNNNFKGRKEKESLHINKCIFWSSLCVDDERL